MVVNPKECPNSDCESEDSKILVRDWYMDVCEELRKCNECGQDYKVLYEPSDKGKIQEW